MSSDDFPLIKLMTMHSLCLHSLGNSTGQTHTQAQAHTHTLTHLDLAELIGEEAAELLGGEGFSI